MNRSRNQPRTSSPGILWIEEEAVNVERSPREDFGKDADGFVDLFGDDVQMRHGSVRVSTQRIDKDALLFERGHQFGRSAALVDDVENDDIGFHVLRDDVDRGNLLKEPSQLFGMLMIGLQPSDMSLQGIDPGGGDDAGLTHGSSVHPAEAARAIDDLLVI